MTPEPLLAAPAAASSEAQPLVSGGAAAPRGASAHAAESAFSGILILRHSAGTCAANPWLEDRGLPTAVDRYEAKYGSGRVEHAPRRASASRDRPSSGDSNASHADDRACADQTRPSASTTVLFADLLSPEKQYALLQRPEDSRALPSAGAGCPSAHTRLPSRLPLNPFQALARRVQPPVPLGHRGQRHADRVRAGCGANGSCSSSSRDARF